LFGRNILATIATSWSEVRFPIGKIVSMLKAVYDLKISAGTINNTHWSMLLNHCRDSFRAKQYQQIEECWF